MDEIDWAELDPDSVANEEISEPQGAPPKPVNISVPAKKTVVALTGH